MKKMTYKHINALSTISKLLRKYIRRDPTNELLSVLQKDIELLDDIRRFIQHQITNPTLPFGVPDRLPMFNPIREEACEVG